MHESPTGRRMHASDRNPGFAPGPPKVAAAPSGGTSDGGIRRVMHFSRPCDVFTSRPIASQTEGSQVTELPASVQQAVSAINDVLRRPRALDPVQAKLDQPVWPACQISIHVSAVIPIQGGGRWTPSGACQERAAKPHRLR